MQHERRTELMTTSVLRSWTTVEDTWPSLKQKTWNCEQLWNGRKCERKRAMVECAIWNSLYGRSGGTTKSLRRNWITQFRFWTGPNPVLMP